MMFARVIPTVPDFEEFGAQNSSVVFMVGRMAEREGFEPSMGF
jgi:hypothetical protein